MSALQQAAERHTTTAFPGTQIFCFFSSFCLSACTCLSPPISTRGVIQVAGSRGEKLSQFRLSCPAIFTSFLRVLTSDPCSDFKPIVVSHVNLTKQKHVAWRAVCRMKSAAARRPHAHVSSFIHQHIGALCVRLGKAHAVLRQLREGDLLGRHHPPREQVDPASRQKQGALVRWRSCDVTKRRRWAPEGRSTGLGLRSLVRNP